MWKWCISSLKIAVHGVGCVQSAYLEKLVQGIFLWDPADRGLILRLGAVFCLEGMLLVLVLEICESSENWFVLNLQTSGQVPDVYCSSQGLQESSWAHGWLTLRTRSLCELASFLGLVCTLLLFSFCFFLLVYFQFPLPTLSLQLPLILCKVGWGVIWPLCCLPNLSERCLCCLRFWQDPGLTSCTPSFFLPSPCLVQIALGVSHARPSSLYASHCRAVSHKSPHQSHGGLGCPC